MAGGKLVAGSVLQDIVWIDSLPFSLIVKFICGVFYTSLGGIKAVIYPIDSMDCITRGCYFWDFATLSWEVGTSGRPPSHYFSLANISCVTLLNWGFAIIPIWFIAMTLYQRVYSTKNVREAKKAFIIAGVFEYPLMSFSGVILGMLARVAYPESEAETALPMMINHVLPIGIAGFVLAAYFSAVMSTAIAVWLQLWNVETYIKTSAIGKVRFFTGQSLLL